MNPATKHCPDGNGTSSRGETRPEPFSPRLPCRESRRFQGRLCQNRGIRREEAPRSMRELVPRQGRGCPPQGPSSRGSEFLVTGSGSLPGRLGLGDAEPLLSRTLAGFPLPSAARVFGRRSENVLSLDSFPPVPFVGKAISAVVSINTVYGVKVFPARFAGQSPPISGEEPQGGRGSQGPGLRSAVTFSAPGGPGFRLLVQRPLSVTPNTPFNSGRHNEGGSTHCRPASVPRARQPYLLHLGHHPDHSL